MNLISSTKPSPSGLHTITVENRRAYIYRSLALLQLSAIIMLIFHRFAALLESPIALKVPLLLVSVSECLLSFSWLMLQSFYLNPISREVHPECLPQDDHLPNLDVFIFTANPIREPTPAVMNTVLSALALDYPPDKLHVYLSDDAGDTITLFATQQAWNFAASSWLQFTRKYTIKTLSPEAYFYGDDNGALDPSLSDLFPEFAKEHEAVKLQFDEMKKQIIEAREGAVSDSGSFEDHPPVIKVFNEDEAVKSRMPRLVYVAREKRPLKPHHFKAGAINALLRVSAILSDSPYILFLDCDMNCNDPMSAKQAMCFHLDPTLSSDLSFVQFPQKFRGLSASDIYDAEYREFFRMYWHGMDGIGGPMVMGTNVFLKRASLFGPPSEIQKRVNSRKIRELEEMVKECNDSARLEYEDGLKWGEEVGFLYFSVMEDIFTGFVSLHCKGWKSLYYYPKRAAFLGFPTTSFSKFMTQYTRWSSGLIKIALSHYSPIIYGFSKKINVLACMCYANIIWMPLLYSVSVWLMGTVPALCVVFGTSVYEAPTARNLAVFLFLCCAARSVFDNLDSGGTVQNAMAVTRIWWMKSVTCFTYGCLEGLMNRLNVTQQQFIPTEKVADEEGEQMYQMGRFDFRASRWFVCPLVILVFLNLVAFAVGVARMCISGEFYMELFVCSYALIMGFPILQGVFARRDKGAILPHDALISAVCVVGFILVGYLLLAPI